MSTDNRRIITRLVDSVVEYLTGYGADCIVIAMDRDGYYAMRSNLGKSHVWVMLDQAQAKLKEQIEVERSAQNEDQNGKEM